MNARTCPRTASSRGSNQSLPANGDGAAGQAGVASFSIVPIGTYATSANFHQPRDTTVCSRACLRRSIGTRKLTFALPCLKRETRRRGERAKPELSARAVGGNPDPLRATMETFGDAGGRRSSEALCGADYGERAPNRPTAAMAAARSWDTRLDAILLEIPSSYYPTVCSSAGARPRRLSCEWSSRHEGAAGRHRSDRCGAVLGRWRGPSRASS